MVRVLGAAGMLGRGRRKKEVDRKKKMVRSINDDR